MTRARARRAAAVGALCLLSTVPALGCGDGRPEFCDRLQDVSSLRSLRTAIDRGDLTTARDEARRLREVADDAPPEVRTEFRSLAAAVADVVELLAVERSPVARGPGSGAGTTSTTAPDGTAGGPAGADPGTGSSAPTTPGTPTTAAPGGAGAAEPAEVERRREQLNRRLGELGDDGSAVTAWAADTCGVDLGA